MTVTATREFDHGAVMEVHAAFEMTSAEEGIELIAPISESGDIVATVDFHLSASAGLHFIEGDALFFVDSTSDVTDQIDFGEPHGKTGTFNGYFFNTDTTPTLDGERVCTVESADNVSTPVNITSAGSGVGGMVVEGKLIYGGDTQSFVPELNQAHYRLTLKLASGKGLYICENQPTSAVAGMVTYSYRK